MLTAPPKLGLSLDLHQGPGDSMDVATIPGLLLPRHPPPGGFSAQPWSGRAPEALAPGFAVPFGHWSTPCPLRPQLLCSCQGGRLVSADPHLLAYPGTRVASKDTSLKTLVGTRGHLAGTAMPVTPVCLGQAPGPQLQVGSLQPTQGTRQAPRPDQRTGQAQQGQGPRRGPGLELTGSGLLPPQPSFPSARGPLAGQGLYPPPTLNLAAVSSLKVLSSSPSPVVFLF